MKPGHVLDNEIALKLFQQKIKDPFSTPPYSTDVWHSYLVIEHLQKIGWICRVKSNVAKDGSPTFIVKFVKNNLESQCRDETLPMAICMAGLAVANNQYTVVEKKATKISNSGNSQNAEILDFNKLFKQTKQSPINVNENPFETELIDQISNIISNAQFTCNQKQTYKMAKLLFKLEKKQVIPTDLKSSMATQLAQIIFDQLNVRGYTITKSE